MIGCLYQLATEFGAWYSRWCIAFIYVISLDPVVTSADTMPAMAGAMVVEPHVHELKEQPEHHSSMGRMEFSAPDRNAIYKKRREQI